MKKHEERKGVEITQSFWSINHTQHLYYKYTPTIYIFQRKEKKVKKK